jgi:hypothetical protein
MNPTSRFEVETPWPPDARADLSYLPLLNNTQAERPLQKHAAQPRSLIQHREYTCSFCGVGKLLLQKDQNNFQVAS